jgi:hypothetical protein
MQYILQKITLSSLCEKSSCVNFPPRIGKSYDAANAPLSDRQKYLHHVFCFCTLRLNLNNKCSLFCIAEFEMERRLLIFQSGGVEALLLSKLDAQITRLVQTYSLGEAFLCHIK